MATREKKSGNRVPIATGALVLVMLGAFGVSTKMVGAARVDSDVLLAEAAEYLLEHPYLEVHPRLEDFAGADKIDLSRSAFWMARERRGAPPIPSTMRKRRQQILDEKVDRSFEALDGLPDRVWGLHPKEPTASSFLTYSFIHSRFLHLATSVLLFCWLGILLERVWGSPIFLGFALCSAVVSGGAFVWANPELDASLIGYSGVVAASLGAYVVNAGNSGRGVNYAVTVCIAGALLFVPSLFGQEWSLAPVSSGAVFGPSQWSVLGGMIFGMMAPPVIWLATLDTAGASGLTKRDVAARGLLQRARKAANSRHKDKSVALFKQAIQQNPTDRRVLHEAWLVATQIGREKSAIALMLAAIRDELRSGEQDAATRHWFELLAAVPDVQAEPGLLIRLAPLIHDQGRSDEAARVLECALDVVDSTSAPEVASSVALAARDFEPELARRAAQRALGFDYLDPERRSSLELLLGRLPKRAEEAGPKTPPGPSSDTLCFDDSPDREAGASTLDSALQESVGIESPAEDPQQTDEMWELPDSLEVETRGSHENSIGDARSPSSGQSVAAGPASHSIEGEFALDLSDEVEDLTDILAPPSQEATPATESGSAVAEAKPSPIEVDVVAAVPVGITPDHLEIEVAGKGKRALDLHDIDAIATAWVGGIAPSPVVIIDLVLNWSAGGTEPLRVVRLGSNDFDARQIMDVDLSGDDALRELLKHLLAVANPAPLPDPMSACGLPFAEFADLDEYERIVLAREDGEELELL